MNLLLGKRVYWNSRGTSRSGVVQATFNYAVTFYLVVLADDGDGDRFVTVDVELVTLQVG